MALSTDKRRRVLGVIFLTLAGGMLLCGQTVLSSRLDGAAYILYWLVCFACTILAILTALADLRALRQRTQQAQRDLVRETFGKLPDEPSSEAKEPKQ